MPPDGTPADQQKVLDDLKAVCSGDFTSLDPSKQQLCVVLKKQLDEEAARKKERAAAIAHAHAAKQKQQQLEKRVGLVEQRLQTLGFVVEVTGKRRTEATLLLGAVMLASNNYDKILGAKAAKSVAFEIFLGLALAALPHLGVVHRILKAVPVKNKEIWKQASNSIQSSNAKGWDALADEFGKVVQTTKQNGRPMLMKFADKLDGASKDTIEAIKNPLMANKGIDEETQKKFKAHEAKNQMMVELISNIQRALVMVDRVTSLVNAFSYWYEGPDLVKIVKGAFKLTGLDDDIAYKGHEFDAFAEIMLYDMLRTYVKSYVRVRSNGSVAELEPIQVGMILARFGKTPWKDPSRPPLSSTYDFARHWGAYQEPKLKTPDLSETWQPGMRLE